jgi:hypothetical protein
MHLMETIEQSEYSTITKVITAAIEKELTAEEKLVERELSEAAKAFERMEQKYELVGFLGLGRK